MARGEIITIIITTLGQEKEKDLNIISGSLLNNIITIYNLYQMKRTKINISPKTNKYG